VDTSEAQRSSPGVAASESHDTRVVVWDVPPAVERGATFRLKVGINCALGCRAEAWSVEIRSADGRTLASASPSDVPWSGTTALYVAEMEVDAPTADGLHAWEACIRAIAAARPHDIGHPAARARFNVRVVPAPQCRLKVIAVDARSQLPVKGARVVVHPYRASTDEDGVAELDVPKGEYRVFVSGRSYLPFRSDGEVATDTTIKAELDADLGASDAELWG
jgi:hypothetical protein